MQAEIGAVCSVQSPFRSATVAVVRQGLAPRIRTPSQPELMVIPPGWEAVVDGPPIENVVRAFGQFAGHAERKRDIAEIGSKRVGIVAAKAISEERSRVLLRGARGLEFYPHLTAFKDYFVKVIHHVAPINRFSLVSSHLYTSDSSPALLIFCISLEVPFSFGG